MRTRAEQILGKFAVRGRLRGRSSQPNKLEEAYAQYLDGLRAGGMVKWWGWDCFKVRLADRTWYETDFLVLMADDTLEIHETKGHWEDDARVKVKVAAEAIPIPIRIIRKVKGGGFNSDEVI